MELIVIKFDAKKWEENPIVNYIFRDSEIEVCFSVYEDGTYYINNVEESSIFFHTTLSSYLERV
jgi:hypothetical protein